VLATRPVPVQLSYLGSPVPPLDARAADFIVVDHIASPPDATQHGNAAFPAVYLPPPFHASTAWTSPPPPPSTSADVANTVVFAATLSAACTKRDPRLLAAWANSLRAAGGRASLCFVVDSDDSSCAQNLRAHLLALGVRPDLLHFASWRNSNGGEGGCKSAASAVLDTFVYGSHSTAADALAAGLPVLGFIGDELHRRVSASFASVRSWCHPALSADLLLSHDFMGLETTMARFAAVMHAGVGRLCPLLDAPPAGVPPPPSQPAFFPHQTAVHLEAAYHAAFEVQHALPQLSSAFLQSGRLAPPARVVIVP